ncbi:11028_t:CDS:1, partial [Acaulospora morrowiae]
QDFLLQEELQKLCAELVFLENKYKDVCIRNIRLKTFMRTHGTQYRKRIQSLLEANTT